MIHLQNLEIGDGFYYLLPDKAIIIKIGKNHIVAFGAFGGNDTILYETINNKRVFSYYGEML